jgi:hypothetical protein
MANNKTKYMSDEAYQALLDRLGTLRETLAARSASVLIQNPQMAELLNARVDDLLTAVDEGEAEKAVPPDGGLAGLVGIGAEASTGLGEVRVAPSVKPYDEVITPERIRAVADLYYIYQHEMLGVFRVTLKLQELFKAGVVRLSFGDGAGRLYRYDRRQVLRYTQLDRMQAYLRAFGYTNVPPSPGAMPNRQFHGLFSQFVGQVGRFFRDKRISEVVRERANDPSFGSIAIVRRAGLDLRYNLKNFSYGHLNVLRLETLQLLEEAFKILEADDIRSLFGADNAWDVIEDVLRRYFGEQVNVSARNRMAIAGRDVIRWLAQRFILNTTRAPFESNLQSIAEPCEEWLTSAQTVGVTARIPNGNGKPAAIYPMSQAMNG